MKHFLLILTLLLIPFMLFASNDDLSKSKGTTQDVIVQLTPSPAQEDVSRNGKIEVTFSVPLDVSSIQEYNIKLTHLSSKTNEHIAGIISYSQTDKKLIFTPKASLEAGLYEVEIKSLKADKAHKATKINEIKYRFVVINEVLQSITIRPDSIELKEGESLQLEVKGHYDTGAEKDISAHVQWSITDSQIVTVDANATLKALKEGTTSVTAKMESVEVSTETTVYKEINGHRLPPEPDKATNDTTLLGVDVNGNGVRDDVERYIYIRFFKDSDYPKTKIALAMQYAWASQKILENPTFESNKYEDDALSCESYLWGIKTKNMSGLEFVKFRIKHKVFGDPELKDKIYNTRKRIEQKFSYNATLSGRILDGGGENTIERCRINIDKFGE